MSNHTIECQLDLVIKLLETLPKRLCEALNKKDSQKSVMNKIDCIKVKPVFNDEESMKIAEQLTEMMNNNLQNLPNQE